MTNKKILVVATTDNMIWQFLIPHIKHMQSLGNTVECACNKSGFWFDELKDKYGFVMHEITSARNPLHPKNIKGYKQLKKLVMDEKFDLIYCQQPVGGLLGRLVGSKCKIPVIYTAHGFHFFKGAPLKNNLIFKPVEKWLAKKTDVLITINDEDYQNALKMKAKKVYKINGIGVDLSKYSQGSTADRDEMRTSLGIDKDDFVVLSIGELNKNKNTLRLLSVINSIPDTKIKYVICGQGPLKQKYVDYINKNNLNDRVKMLGFRKDIPAILSMSDVFIMPSYREGLPKSMLEAMSVGVPLLGSRIRGISDLIGDNEGGILFDPKNNEEIKNAIVKLASDKALAQKYATRNKNYVQNYSIDVVIDQLEKIYEEII